MFHELIGYFIDIILEVLYTIINNDILAYIFYLGIFGLIVSVIMFIISLNNSHLGGKGDK